jgi:hypothetical protein
MGTAGEWLQVLLLGGLWGGAMAWWSARDRPLRFSSPRGRVLHLVLWAMAGLLFGILVVFQWRQALHPPLVFATAAAVVGMLVVAWLVRKQRTVK